MVNSPRYIKVRCSDLHVSLPLKIASCFILCQEYNGHNREKVNYIDMPSVSVVVASVLVSIVLVVGFVAIASTKFSDELRAVLKTTDMKTRTNVLITVFFH